MRLRCFLCISAGIWHCKDVFLQRKQKNCIMKTIQEIFKQEPVRLIEDAIFDACQEHEWMHFADSYGNNVTRLLEIRKQLLDREFVMDEQYKSLLSEFNEALKKALLTMRTQAIAAAEAVYSTPIECDISVTCKCFIDYLYPPAHPIQTKRAKKMWEILTGRIDNYIPLYKDGVESWCFFDKNYVSENMLLYLNDTIYNWNEGFDWDMTKDMHLVHAVHALFRHMDFSIFDLLWVREFKIMVEVSTSHSTGSEKSVPDISWDEIAY